MWQRVSKNSPVMFFENGLYYVSYFYHAANGSYHDYG